MRKVVKLFKTKATSIDEANKTVTFQISDNQVDRMGEIVDQKTWNFKDYLANPIVLWGHNPDEPENVLGTAETLEVADDGSNTMARVKFDTDINAKADLIFNQVKRGTLRCVSVGFMNHTTDVEDDTPVLKDNELLEISVVPIPANPRAIALDLKAGVLSKKDAKWLSDSMRKEAEFLEEQLKQETNSEDNDVNEQVSKNVATLLEAVTALSEAQKKTDERVNSFIEAQEKAATREKATIAEELAEDQAYEKKWANVQVVSDIWWAFLDVYFDDETNVEDFDRLLGEYIDLLAEVRDGNYTAPEGEAEDEDSDLEKALRTVDSARYKQLVLSSRKKNVGTEDDSGDDDAEDETEGKQAEADATEDSEDGAEKNDDKEGQDSDETKVAKDGDNDQSGAAKDVELDLDTELTPELEAQIESALNS